MTKTSEAASDGRRRKLAVATWTRDKIASLIQLYRQHECLWNHYIDTYKSKEHRNKSIDEICRTLNITKFDFGKKIHNLRNQYNSEMKKLERRIEESGGESELSGGAGRCRWEHFESLMFLRNIIESRPCGYQASFRQPKKMRLKFDYISEDEAEQHSESQTNAASVSAPTISAEDVTEYHFEEAAEDEETLEEQVVPDDFQNYDVQEVHDATAEAVDELFDEKYNPLSNAPLPPRKLTTLTSSVPTPTNKTYVTRVVQQKQKQTQSQENETPLPPMGAVIELPTGVASCSSSTRTSVEHQQTHLLCTPSSASSELRAPSRDQWDNFGELIATEFRHLNSDVSRKKLKRKIMQAMLEVGEEDDAISLSGQN